ncbi:MerR family transcriptional regulator [Oleisolibacter albus]|uniref:MerR family transcriptional regulator n=1 Tax=Oleisolibacter albus TaxID=2171757 RepID=UPI000DF288DE|nr:helix-turn-helix domain-containing protein [Oleisolibacter albus]
MSARCTIGDLARSAGTKVETIRWYEREGLLPPAERSSGNYRLYTAAHQRRLVFIRRARELGFSLEAVRTLLDLADHPTQPCHAADALAARHLAEVERKLADLERLRDSLRALTTECGHGTAADCRILEALSA